MRPRALTRRTLLAAALSLQGGAAFAAPDAAAAELAAIERRVGGRLGVTALDVASGRRIARRADERFPMCSTFKLLAAAAVLARVDAGRERLDRRIAIRRQDMLSTAPRTEPKVGSTMTLAELCSAAVELSDNPAANYLLATLGGPAGVTTFLRGIGDPATRLDRNEPSLNTSVPGDPRDTTTPAAMLATVQKLVLGPVLHPPSRTLLTRWLVASPTGAKRVRAKLPSAWRAGGKTGTGAHGSTNDVVILWPPRGGPILVAAYLTGTDADLAAREGALANVGAVVVRRLGRA